MICKPLLFATNALCQLTRLLPKRSARTRCCTHLGCKVEKDLDGELVREPLGEQADAAGPPVDRVYPVELARPVLCSRFRRFRFRFRVFPVPFQTDDDPQKEPLDDR